MCSWRQGDETPPRPSPCEDNDDNRNAPSDGAGNTPMPGRRCFRVSPIAALAVAIAALVWLFGLESNRFGFHIGDRPVVSPEEAVDISLKRLVRTHVSERLEREHRLTSSPQRNREIIDDELTRIREHPLYAMIKKQMTDHLRDEGYAEVLIKPTQEPSDPMVSLEPEIKLSHFIHSMKASFPVPNEKIAPFLKDQEKLFGKALVDFRGPDRCDCALNAFITLLYDYPDDLDIVAGSVTFNPISQEEIERVRRGTTVP